MRRLLLVPVLFATVVVARTQALKQEKQTETPIIWNGNSLFDQCQGYKANKLEGKLGQGCFFYIAGVTQTVLIHVELKTMPPICPGKHVTQEQIVDIVVKWLEDHPEKRELRAENSHMSLLEEIGEVIAERRLYLEGQPDADIRVRIRRPQTLVSPSEGDLVLCPFQVLGIGDEKVRSAGGVYEVQAVQLAMEMIGAVLYFKLNRKLRR